MARVIVIGAGLAGMLAAEKLHNLGHDVIVLERLERVGGIWILHEDYNMVEEQPWVKLGVTALAIHSNCVLTDMGKYCGDIIIEATGFREKTPAELGIYGTRPSGVYSLWSAMRMIEFGWRIGKKIVIYGCNKWAYGLAKMLLEKGAEVEVLGTSPWCRNRAVIKELGGSGRLTHVITNRGVIYADTLIIAEVTPHGWLGATHKVGNSAIVIDEIPYLSKAVELFVKSLEVGGFEIQSIGLEAYPPLSPGEVVVKLPAPGVIDICGFKTIVSEQYTVLNVKKGCILKYVRNS